MMLAIISHLTHFYATIGRLCCTDGSEFLFLAATEREMEDWVNKISFHATLPPSLQLLSYDDSHKVN
jgi:spectrin beta